MSAKINKSTLLATAASVGLTLLSTQTFADSGYQPYYYYENRGAIQYMNTGSAPAPVQYREKIQYTTTGTESPTQWTTPQAPSSDNKIALGTIPGASVGATAASYGYAEHVVKNEDFMHMTGIKFGITFDAATKLKYGFFLGGDVRFAYNKNDYWSAPSGDIDDFAGDFLGEGRITIGYDYIQDNPSNKVHYSVSPYSGVGFRDLFSDSSGIDGGYRRNSQYFYMPFGATARARITDQSRLSLNLEYDMLLQGWQTSYTSDADPTLPDMINDQNHGYGLRGSLLYEKGPWSIGPFFNYWNINRSEVAYFYDPAGGGLYGFVEPHNQTLEYGGKIAYRFW